MKKTAIVTGGCRGIGYAVSKRLGTDGCNIVIMSTSDQERYAEQLGGLTSLGIEWIYVKGSIEDSAARQRTVDEAVSRFGRIDILVNNAGVAPEKRCDILEMTEESYDRVMGINARGTMFMTQLVANRMKDQERIFPSAGHIINIGSCSSEVSSVTRGEYCISKAAVSMITTLFADRLAEYGILVNEVRPGVISTDMTSGVREKYYRLISDGAFPIARWGTPEDVAGAVSFFASDDLLYTTGEHIDIDGGFHIKKL